MSVISFTKTVLPYGWLGNMSPFPIIYNGKQWRTTEAVFQSMRFDDENLKEAIRNEKSPMGAKLKAKSNIDKMVITPLSEQDVKNMYKCLLLKINQHPHLIKELLETGDSQIIEDVTKRGSKGSNLFWGAMLVDNEWKGENTLGKLWMRIRNEIKP